MWNNTISNGNISSQILQVNIVAVSIVWICSVTKVLFKCQWFPTNLPQVHYLREKRALSHFDFWRFQFWTKVPKYQAPGPSWLTARYSLSLSAQAALPTFLFLGHPSLPHHGFCTSMLLLLLLTLLPTPSPNAPNPVSTMLEVSTYHLHDICLFCVMSTLLFYLLPFF